MSTTDTNKALGVVAVVQVNSDEALVLNRPLKFTYERVGMDYIGSDGPFRDFLGYQRAGERFVAFAGRELSLPMLDGSIQKIKDHWWSGILPGMRSIACGDIDSLKKCYVFHGGMCISPGDFSSLRSTYTGCVYPYWDYEKVIRYDDMRKELWGRVFHEERRTRALIKAVRAKHIDLQSALANIQGGAA